MLTDRAEAAIEHLVDANPAHTALLQHRELLQAARADGIPRAYANLCACDDSSCSPFSSAGWHLNLGRVASLLG